MAFFCRARSNCQNPNDTKTENKLTTIRKATVVLIWFFSRMIHLKTDTIYFTCNLMSVIMLIKTLIFFAFALMISTLFRGLFFLGKDGDNKKGLINALTLRVVSAVILVILIIIGIKTGTLQPHGLNS